MGRSLKGTYTALPCPIAFENFAALERIDFRQSLNEEPTQHLTPIIGHYDRKGGFQIVNPSETLHALDGTRMTPTDHIWVLVLRDRAAINALKLAAEPFFIAMTGREPMDAAPFLRLCFTDEQCSDPSGLEQAKLFRQWCGPSSKAYSLNTVIEKFGFHPKRAAKFREIKLREGLTHAQPNKQSDKPKTPVKLATQQNRLRRFLKTREFKSTAYIWGRSCKQQNHKHPELDQLPDDFRLICAMAAAASKKLRNPCRTLAAQCDVEIQSIDIVADVINTLKAADIDPSAVETQQAAKILLASIGSRNDE